MNRLNIIVVNWNAGQLLYHCLASVFNSNLEKSLYHVYVVDNNSSDNSLTLIEGLSENLTIIKNKDNVGFGNACNYILERYSSEFVLLLNPDVSLPEETLKDSLVFMCKNPHIDVLGVKNYNLNNVVVPSCARFPSPGRYFNDILGLSKILPGIFKPATIMTDWDHLNSAEVDHVIGAYMMIRSSILDKSGLFDPDFFLYLEDLDLSKRIKSSGGIIYYNSNIFIIHEGGGVTKSVKSNQLFFSLQSRIIYSQKYFSKLSVIMIIVLSCSIEPLTRSFFLLLKGNFNSFSDLFKGYRKYFKWI